MAVKRIVGVATGIKGVEGVAVIWVEGQAKLYALWQVWIGDEMPAKCHQVGIPLLDDRLGAIGLEAAGGDDCSFENLSQTLCCNWGLAFFNDGVAFDSWLQDVEICETKLVQSLSKIVKQRSWVAVRHP